MPDHVIEVDSDIEQVSGEASGMQDDMTLVNIDAT